jgi:hypothetical protein
MSHIADGIRKTAQCASCLSGASREVSEVLERHRNPVASVTTVLNRLVDYGEARSILAENGPRVWEWNVESEKPTAVNPSRDPMFTVQRRAGDK